METEVLVIQEHVMVESELMLHKCTESCECHPDKIEGEDVYLHQRLKINKSGKAAEYKTYLRLEDGSIAEK